MDEKKKRFWYANFGALYKELVMKQGEACAVCGKLRTGKRLDIDHNHQTDQIRSLLCHRCNIMVGFIENYPDLIQPMVEYLDFWDKQE